MLAKLARYINHSPRLASFIHNAYRRFQPRFTVGAVGVLLDERNRVLLVEHVFHSRYPWGLPGGWVNPNELPSLAVEREFKEETGLDVQALYPLEIWSTHRWRNHLDMAFAVQTRNKIDLSEISLSFELVNYCWAEWKALPELMPVQRYLIQKAMAYQQQLQTIPQYIHQEERE